MVILRIFFCFQLMNILLKLDDFVGGSWREIFWPFWIVFSILIGLSFTIFLILVTKVCSMICVKTEKSESNQIKNK